MSFDTSNGGMPTLREILKAEEDARMAQIDKILRGGSAAESTNTPPVNTSLDDLIPQSPS